MTGQPTAPIQDGLAWIRQPLTLLAVPRLATSGVRPQHAKVLGGLIHTSTSGPHDGLRLSRNVAGSDDDKGIGTLQATGKERRALRDVPGGRAGQDLAGLAGPVRAGAVADLAAHNRKMRNGHGEAANLNCSSPLTMPARWTDLAP
jgi:hypothetical protein